jgi:fatty-acyl-CoA synthase
VLFDNVPELLFLLGGAALSGSVIVALNTTRSVTELAADAARADCDLIIFDPAYAEVVRDLPTAQERLSSGSVSRGSLSRGSLSRGSLSSGSLSWGSLSWGSLSCGSLQGLLESHRDTALVADPSIVPATLLMLIFTSGTSGNPHAVRVTHRKIVIPGESLAGSLLTADDVVYCPMPLFHSGAIMAAFAPALVAGATLVLRRRFSASGLLPDLRRHGCTYLQYVGKALSYALATPVGPDDRDNPLKVAFGNEAAPLEQQAFAERFGCRVIDAYGSTETAISLSPDPLGPQGAIGRLADGVKILNSETGAQCRPARFDVDGRLTNADEAIGELVGTHGRGLFDGYYNDTEADAQRLREGMFWSGDFGYADENGYVFFTGRSLDRLRVDGENFGAVQVERVLAGLPGLDRFAVYGVPDVAAGDQVMLSVVMDHFDPQAFTAYLAQRRDLSPKWVPRYIRVARELPATASNKILKRRLALEGWHTADPVWWRPGKDLTYRLMTSDDRAHLRGEFESRGRLHLLADSTAQDPALSDRVPPDRAPSDPAPSDPAAPDHLERSG